MKKIFSSLLVVVLLVSCGSDIKNDMTVSGTITGLKKGTVYLKKYKDTLLVAVDSAALNGSGSFILSDKIESPEIYIITLDKLPKERITFFGEKGELTIKTKLEKFSVSAKIEGSNNQKLLDEYNAMIQQFNGKNLDLFKASFDAQKNNDTALISKINSDKKSLVRRKYLYSTNFALNHATTEVAPYIALTQLYNANIQLLDTINNSLATNIKESKYGKELEKFIKEIKEKQN